MELEGRSSVTPVRVSGTLAMQLEMRRSQTTMSSLPSRSPRPAAPSLPLRLALLIAGIVLPLTAFAALQIYFNYDISRRSAHEGILQIARGLSATVDGQLRTATASLEVLALSRSLQQGDLEGFRAQANELLQASYPGSNIVLIDRTGQQMLNTSVPTGEALPLRDSEHVRGVFQDGRPQISNLSFGPVLRRFIIIVAVPARRDGEVVYDLAMSLPLKTFNDLLHQQRADPGWTIALFDRAMGAVARIPGGEQTVGQPPSASFRPFLVVGGEGVLDSTTMEGVDVLTAFTHSRLSGWSVAVGVPKAAFVKPLLRAVVLLGCFGAACLAVGIGLAARLATRLTRTEMERSLLINELNHRVKNTLAMAQSMTVNTLRRATSVADGRSAVEARLMAMARVHELLTEAHWTSADLGDLINRIVEPFRTHEVQIRSSGPALRISPRAATTLAIVINELATNATKYGSLARPEGALDIAWDIVDGRSLRLTWREFGGRAPADPSTAGFGSVLIERSAKELGGMAVQDFAPQGLVTTIDLPLREIAAGPAG
jgi:two-component sensor histidine kinase